MGLLGGQLVIYRCVVDASDFARFPLLRTAVKTTPADDCHLKRKVLKPKG